jgi:hypothetical protein
MDFIGFYIISYSVVRFSIFGAILLVSHDAAQRTAESPGARRPWGLSKYCRRRGFNLA